MNLKPKDVLSPELLPPDLKPGETVTFRVINLPVFNNRVNVETGQAVIHKPGIHQILGKRSVYDTYKKTRVMIGNVVSQQYDEKKDKWVDTTEDVLFDKNGLLRVTDKENDKYQYLMCIDINASNPHRDPNVKAKFEVVDEAKRVKEEMSNFDLKDEAIEFLKSCDYKELIAWAKNLPNDLKGRVNTENPIDFIRRDLRLLIDQGDAITVIKAATGAKANKIKTLIQITECEKYNFIKRDNQTRNWIFRDGVKITEVPVEEPMLEYLRDFLMKNKEGAEPYEAIKKFLKDMKK